MRTIGLLGICLALASCTNVNPSLIVMGSILPTNEGGGCSSDPEDPTFVLRPTLNRANSVGIAQFDYRPDVLVANQRVRRSTDLVSDVAGVNLQFAQVELQDAAGTPLVFPGLPNPFRLPVPGNGFVPSATDGETAGLAPVSVTLVPVVYQSLLTDGTIIAEATFFGTGVDGADVESSPWSLTIDICSGGCLFQCEPGDADPVIACTPGHDSPSRARAFNAALGCATASAP